MALIEDEGIKLIARSALTRVGNLFFAVFKKRDVAAEETGDVRRVELEKQRLNDTVAAMQGRIEELRDRVNWRFADEEASDPSFASFVDEAMSASAASGSEAKRLMLGRMIAQRLLTQTGDPEELLLKRALRVVEDLTDEQLRLLGIIAFVQHMPLDDVRRQFASRDLAERWLREHYFELARKWKNTTHWTYEDLETLASLGTIRFPGGDLSGSSSSIQTWLMQRGVSPYDGMEADAGTREARTRYQERFPTITILEHLAAGTKPRQMPETAGQRLDTLILTPLGDRIGTMVLDQSLGGGGPIERYVLMRRDVQPSSNA